MTVELTWLTYTAMFAASLWMPFIVGVDVTDLEGKTDLFSRPPDHSKLPPSVHRSLRAHQNLLEQFAPFVAIVLGGAIAGVWTPITRIGVVIFFWLPVAHAIGMISGLARLPLRPMIYVAGWAVTLLCAWQVLTVAGSR